MPATLKVKLSLEEDKRLLEISQREATGKRVKQRTEAIRLSSHGWKVAQIAAYFERHEQTVQSSKDGNGMEKKGCMTCPRQEDRNNGKRQT